MWSIIQNICVVIVALELICVVIFCVGMSMRWN